MLVFLGFIIFFGAAGALVTALLIKDAHRTQRINFFARFFALAIIVAVGLHYTDNYINEMRDRAFQSELRSEINLAQKYQDTFHKEYNRYAPGSADLGYLHGGGLYQFYFSEQELPIYLKHNLEKQDWPYATNDDYQFVIEVRRRNGANPEILIQPKTGPLRGLEKR